MTIKMIVIKRPVCRASAAIQMGSGQQTTIVYEGPLLRRNTIEFRELYWILNFVALDAAVAPLPPKGGPYDNLS
jgi:hypothetical protein